MLSVVIPAYNEEENIVACLAALTKQTTSQEFEVIVVDNNSTDKTTEVARTFGSKLNLTVIQEPKKGRSAARAAGFAAAKGEIIFSTDADAMVPPDWIEKLLPAFSHEQVIATTGTCYIDDCDWFTNQVINTIQPLAMHGFRLMFGHYWLSGFNFAVRRSTFEKSSGFDTALNAHEDTDLAFKIAKLGKIEFVGHVPVHFSGRRFQNGGLVSGMISYLTSFWWYHQGNKKKAYLSDIR